MIDRTDLVLNFFKLLIVAVVAIVIFVGLLSWAGPVPIPKTNMPNEEAGKLITALVVNKASIQSSQVVEFSKDNPQLFAKAIAEMSKYAVSPDQICISAGAFKDDTDNWSNPTPQLVQYNSSSLKYARISGVCNAGGALIQDLSNRKEYDMVNWAGDCGDCTAWGKRETCCFLALKKV